MTQEHPITPPPELIQQWLGEYFGTTVTGEISDVEHVLATQAARWGADQELEACCEWAAEQDRGFDDELRAARRPKSQSLKEQANAALGRFFSNAHTQASQMNQDFEIIRRAVAALPDD